MSPSCECGITRLAALVVHACIHYTAPPGTPCVSQHNAARARADKLVTTLCAVRCAVWRVMLLCYAVLRVVCWSTALGSLLHHDSCQSRKPYIYTRFTARALHAAQPFTWVWRSHLRPHRPGSCRLAGPLLARRPVLCACAHKQT